MLSLASWKARILRLLKPPRCSRRSSRPTARRTKDCGCDPKPVGASAAAHRKQPRIARALGLADEQNRTLAQALAQTIELWSPTSRRTIERLRDATDRELRIWDKRPEQIPFLAKRFRLSDLARNLNTRTCREVESE